MSAAREAAAEGRPQPPLAAGFTYELCAGIIDKPHLDLKGIAHEEVRGICCWTVAKGSGEARTRQRAVLIQEWCAGGSTGPWPARCSVRMDKPRTCV